MRLIDRDRDIAALDGALSATRAANGRVVVIDGADGMGKSALLGWTRRRARVAGLHTLSAPARQREQEAPFELARRLLEPLVATSSLSALDVLFAGAAAPAARLFGRPGAADRHTRAFGDTAPGVEHGDALVHALSLLVLRAGDLDRHGGAGGAGRGRRTGLVLLVDDVHWADWCSLRVFLALAAEIPTARILLVVTCSPDHPAATAVLLGRLGAIATNTLSLRPLSGAGVAEALRVARPGMSPAAAEQRAAHHVENGGGSPLLATELLTQLPTEDVVPRRPAVAGPPSRTLSPRAFTARALARIDGLPPTARAVASALAVLGDDTPEAETRLLANLPRSEVEQAVDQLVGARVLARAPQAAAAEDRLLSFAHPSIGAAVHAELDPTALIGAHRRAAGLRHAAGAPPAVVAFHLTYCPPAGDAEAAGWLAETTRHAAGLGHLRPIRALADRGLAEDPFPAVARQLRCDRAMAGAALGATDSRDQLEQVLAETGDRSQRAELLLTLARVLFTSKRFGEAGRALARASAEVAGDQNEEHAGGGVALASPLAWQLLRDELAVATLRPGDRTNVAARLPALVTEAAALAEPSGPGRPNDVSSIRDRGVPQVGAGLLGQYAIQRATLGAPCAEVRDLALRGLGGDTGVGADFADVGVSSDRFYDLRAGMAIMALLAIDEYNPAESAIEQVLARAQDNGSLIGIGFASHWRSLLRLRRGRLSGAISDAERTLGVCRIGWDVCRNSVATILVAAHLDGGQVPAAVRALAQTDPLDPETDPVVTQPGLVLEARGRVAAAQGRWPDAYRLFIDAGARENEQTGIDPAPTMIPWRSRAAGAATRTGRAAEARTLAGAEVEIARGIGAPRSIAVALRAAAAAAGDEHGRALLAEAVELLEGSQATVDRARALVDYGVARAGAADRPRDRDVARDLLERGLELAEHCAAHPEAVRASRALRAIGGRTRPDAGRAGAVRTTTALTRTERHVAELAADHLSTPAIARTLYVSPKTVEWHLTNAYRKLGVSSRRALLAALTTADLHRT